MLWLWIREVKYSAIAFGASLALGLVSMGLLGIGLYYAVSPVLLLKFPPASKWHGDWVWPAMIAIGMGWSVGFLIAGGVNHYFESRQVQVSIRWGVYFLILWLWALLLWGLTLYTRNPAELT